MIMSLINFRKLQQLNEGKILYRLIKIGKAWFLKIVLLILLILFLYWQLVDIHQALNTSRVMTMTRLEEKRDDNFCMDRYGNYITRKEVQVTKAIKLEKNYFMTIGIPTIERIKNGKRFTYIKESLKDLIKKIPERVKDKILIIIFCADENGESRRRIWEDLNKDFNDLIKNGLIQIIHAPKRFYYDLENVPRTFNNTAIRMKWRGKQSLDYAFLFYYAYGLGRYHLQLEDDVVCEKDFFDKIENDIANTKSKWILFQYYKMGFIGKLIKSEYLSVFADIFRIYYFEMPLDIIYFRPFRYAGLNDQHKMGTRFLFHHIGSFSSSKNFEH